MYAIYDGPDRGESRADESRWTAGGDRLGGRGVLFLSAIQAHGGTNTRHANTYATVNDRNNVAVLGARAKAIQAAGGKRSTRGNALVDKVLLSLIHTTEMLEVHSLPNGEVHGHVAIVCTCDTVASDIETLRRPHGIPDVLATN